MQKIQVFLLELSEIFFSNIFNPWLVESIYATPKDTEAQGTDYGSQ